MSSGKNVAAICMAMMFDQELLSYDETIAKYWPEFSQNGKGEIKVSDLMRHECGLNRLHK